MLTKPSFFTHKFWRGTFFSSLAFWVAFIARISVSPYYFEYVWHRKDLVPLANILDFVSLVGVFAIPWFCKRVSKTAVWIGGLAGSVLCQLVIHAGGSMHSLPVLMIGWVAGIITSGIAMAMPFSLLSDSVDYGEWKNGVRAVGLLSAVGVAFCLKAGSGLGGALPAWLMDVCGYVPNVEQSVGSLKGIALGFIWLPAVFYALAVVPVLFYRKYEDLEPRIHEDLEQRRNQGLKEAC